MSERSASEQIDDIIKQYNGWQAELLVKLRKMINDADESITEEVKWKMPSDPKGLPVWSSNGIVCIVQTFKNDSKLVFFKGAFLDDPKNLFNARLNSATDRAIEFHEGDPIDDDGIRALVHEGIQYNADKKKQLF
jgi:hypothetical protein